MENKKKKIIILAAGGTGGHVFPAIALYRKFIKEGHEVTFFTDDRGLKYLKDIDKAHIKVVPSSSLSGGLKRKFQAVILIFKGILSSLLGFRKLKPDIVIGFGGYPSFPVIFAALIMNIKVYLHEQNSVLGKVNRYLLPFVKNVATSFKETTYLENKKHLNIIYTGNPVREEILSLRSLDNTKVLENKDITLLITGGSQGADFFSEIIPKALVMLPDEIKSRLKIYQQVREKDLEDTRSFYKKAGIDAELLPFFENIAEILIKCDLFIGRAGASTISELITAGKPSVLIPLPAAMDNHQYKNASFLGYKNASLLLEQNYSDSEVVCNSIRNLLSDKEQLSDMALNAYNLGEVNAVEILYNFVILADLKD